MNHMHIEHKTDGNGKYIFDDWPNTNPLTKEQEENQEYIRRQQIIRQEKYKNDFRFFKGRLLPEYKESFNLLEEEL